jgi:hypothetical protein
MPTNETIIPFSRAKLTKLLVLLAGLILSGLFLVIVQPQELGNLLSLVFGILILAIFVFLFAFLVGIHYFRQILKNGPGLIINKDGFTDYSSGIAAGYIPWSEVRALKTVTMPRYKQQFVAVILKDPNTILDRQTNALKRKAMVLNLRKYGSPIQLSPNSLQCSFDDLLKHLQTHFDRNRPSVLN